MRSTLPRCVALMAALALSGLLSACDRTKAPTTPTPKPSTEAGSAPASR
jgi:hypothetical protein